MKKTVAILGATGSVGIQALSVAEKRGFTVDFVSANKSVGEAENIARKFAPRFIAMADEAAARELRAKTRDLNVKVLAGADGVLDGIAETSAQVVVNSIIGEAGLMPTLAVIDSGKRLALANKESLVIAGKIVMSRAKEKGCEIIPVDSEHSAIFQSLKSGRQSEIKRIILTASGGPFYGKTREQLRSVTLEETLAHPTWKMGKKITVDSATLMNKGFEVIEACHLFGTPAEKVEVVIHRESILHSAVEYIDNTVIGEFSVPDMRACVQYAIDYPERCEATIEELDFSKLSKMTFATPDREAFPLLALAERAIKLGGAMPAVLNAADEVAVASFLNGEIRFKDISERVIKTFEKMTDRASEDALEGIIAADREARKICKEI